MDKLNLKNAKSNPGVIVLIQMQDPAGYKSLCESYSAVVYGSIIRMVNDTEIAEELLKATFEKICKNIDQYHSDRLSFLTWILQLARSISIDYLCVAKPQSKPENFKTDKNHSPENGMMELVMIPVNVETRVFNMLMQGLKADEVAAKFDITIEAVRIHLRNGMKLKANRS